MMPIQFIERLENEFSNENFNFNDQESIALRLKIQNALKNNELKTAWISIYHEFEKLRLRTKDVNLMKIQARKLKDLVKLTDIIKIKHGHTTIWWNFTRFESALNNKIKELTMDVNRILKYTEDRNFTKEIKTKRFVYRWQDSE